MPIEQAERIATSQVVWGILFILLFILVVTYLVKTSDKREQKLIDYHEESKAESREREKRLMDHLDAQTEKFGEISNTLGNVQKELVRMNGRMDNLEKEKQHEID